MHLETKNEQALNAVAELPPRIEQALQDAWTLSCDVGDHIEYVVVAHSLLKCGAAIGDIADLIVADAARQALSQVREG